MCAEPGFLKADYVNAGLLINVFNECCKFIYFCGETLAVECKYCEEFGFGSEEVI